MSITDKNVKEVIGFAKYVGLDNFPREIFYGGIISLKEAEELLDEMESEIKEVEKYNPKKQERKDLQKIILDNGERARSLVVSDWRSETKGSRFQLPAASTRLPAM